MLKSYNFSKKDEINSVSATPLKKVKGTVLHVTGAAITVREDEDTKEERQVALITSDQGTFSSISGTVIDGLDLIIDYMTEEETAVDVKVNPSTSNAGREFLTLELM